MDWSLDKISVFARSGHKKERPETSGRFSKSMKTKGYGRIAAGEGAGVPLVGATPLPLLVFGVAVL